MFGRVVGGLDLLKEFEKVECDNGDHPLRDIIIERTTVFVNPFTEMKELLLQEQVSQSMYSFPFYSPP